MRTVANEIYKVIVSIFLAICTPGILWMGATLYKIDVRTSVMETKIAPVPLIMDMAQENRERIIKLETKEEAKKNVVVKKNLLSSPNYMHPFDIIDTSGKSIDNLIKEASIIKY